MTIVDLYTVGILTVIAVSVVVLIVLARLLYRRVDEGIHRIVMIVSDINQKVSEIHDPIPEIKSELEDIKRELWSREGQE